MRYHPYPTFYLQYPHIRIDLIMIRNSSDRAPISFLQAHRNSDLPHIFRATSSPEAKKHVWGIMSFIFSFFYPLPGWALTTPQFLILWAD